MRDDRQSTRLKEEANEGVLDENPDFPSITQQSWFLPAMFAGGSIIWFSYWCVNNDKSVTPTQPIGRPPPKPKSVMQKNHISLACLIKMPIIFYSYSPRGEVYKHQKVVHRRIFIGF